MNFKGVFFEIDDFELTSKLLGEGSFGKVYVVKRVANSDLEDPKTQELNKEYAAKIIKVDPKLGFQGKEQMKLMRESTILQAINHPSIVKFIGINFQSFTDPSKLEPTIITEYLPNGSLKDLLYHKKSTKFKLTPTYKFIYLIGISNAMKYLHQQGIIHRDLKSDNILMDANYYPHICDFGLSKCLKNFLFATMTGAIGTPIYMAPELFDEDPHYTTKVDVFAFAVLAYEIITEKVPYNELGKKINPFALGNKIMKGYRPKFPNDFPPKLKNLIEQCWSPTANERPSFDEIFSKLSNDFSYLGEKLDEDKIREYIHEVDDTSNNDNKEVVNNEIKAQIDTLVSSFYSAIEKGAIDQVKNILSSKIVDINTRFDINNESKTALHIAIENNNTKLVSFLLKQGNIDVNVKSSIFFPFEQIKGENEIEYSDDEDRESTKYPYLDEIEESRKRIRRYKIPPDRIEKYGKSTIEKTPLHIAIENENVKIVQLLLKHEKIDTNIKSKLSKFRKYIEPINESEIKIYDYITKHNIEEKTALHLAIEKQNIQIIRTLLTDEKTDVNIKTLISKKEYYNILKKSQIIKSKIREDKCQSSHCGKFKYEEISALQIAVEKGNSEIVSMLLDNEIIDVNIKSKSEIDYLNVSDFCRDIYEKTALHLAIENNNFDIIELLLNHKFIDVNISMLQEDPWNINRKTPLCIAIEEKNFDAVKLLLQNNSIDVNLTSYFSKKGKIAPIFIAIKKENIDIINLLLNYEGININAIDHKGRKPIDTTENKEIIALIKKMQ